jgi:hypothetical protein
MIRLCLGSRRVYGIDSTNGITGGCGLRDAKPIASVAAGGTVDQNRNKALQSEGRLV